MHNYILGLLLMGLISGAQANSDIDTARADLAGRLNVSISKIEIIQQTEKTWPDSSLGCPVPGMNYKQEIIPGSLLVLGVAGEKYHYHAGGRRNYFYCAQPGKALVRNGPAEDI